MNNLPQQPVTGSQPPRSISSLLVFLCTTLAAGLVVLFVTPKTTIVGLRMLISRNVLHTSYIIVKSQAVATPFVVDAARLQKQGFIVLFFGDYYDSPHIEPIGISEILYAGEYKSQIPIHFPLDKYEKIIAGNRLKNVDVNNIGHPIFVVVYYDDGDGIFSRDSDTLAHDAFGSPMIYKALVN